MARTAAVKSFFIFSESSHKSRQNCWIIKLPNLWVTFTTQLGYKETPEPCKHTQTTNNLRNWIVSVSAQDKGQRCNWPSSRPGPGEIQQIFTDKHGSHFEKRTKCEKTFTVCPGLPRCC